MRKTFIVLLVLVVSASLSFAQKTTGKVKSKKGDIDLVGASGGGNIVCTAGFNDEMSILKRDDAWTLVKASCGQGWISNNDIERVLQGPGDKDMNLETIDVSGWIDNPSAFTVFGDELASLDGIVSIDRDFRDYLKNTVDREQTEIRNHEN